MIETYAPTFIVEIGGQKLPEDISAHIESFVYEENEKQMDELSITITKGDLSYVDHPMLQEGKEVRVRWGYVGNLSEVRTCTIKEINYSFGEDGLIRMEITAYDKRHKLTGRASRQCWKDKTLSEIVKDIAAKHNFINEPVYTFRYGEERDGYLQSFRISSKAEQGKGTGRETVVSGINPMTKEIIDESATQGGV